MTAGPAIEVFEVDPKRLDWGTYDHESEREIDKGDIRGSYSADIIAMNGKVRKPFRWRGELMVCVGTSGRGGLDEADAYRLVPEKAFTGEPTTYNAKTGTAEAAEAARNDSMGFYHGMRVQSGKESFVLCGPEVRFVAAEQPVRPEPSRPETQLDMFAAFGLVPKE